MINRGSRVSFNGGRGGIHARPTARQIAARRHGIAATRAQRVHQQVAARSHGQLASVNHGHPRVAAVQRSLGANRSGMAHGSLSAATHHNAVASGHHGSVAAAHHNAATTAAHHGSVACCRITTQRRPLHTTGRSPRRITTHRRPLRTVGRLPRIARRG